MAAKRMNVGKNRKTQFSRTAVARSAAHVVELLEPRQLLSSVVTTLSVPGADSSNWDGSTAHIIPGPDGNFWFTDPTDNAVGKVTPAGVVTLFPLPVHNAPLDDGSGDVGPDDPGPQDIVVGPNGNLWFTENNVDRVGEITPAGVITEFKTPTADSNPSGLTVGADGDLWFAEENNEAIGRVTAAGKITEFPLATLDVSYQDGMAAGSDGNVWFIADDGDGNGVVASITPSGSVTSYQLNEDPTSITAGPDGDLWIGTSEGQIQQVTTSGQVTTFGLPDYASVNSIRAGTDGNLWFSVSSNNQFGEMNPTSTVIKEFALPSAGAVSANSSITINDLSQASDGTLWFVDANNPQVGTINLTSALLAGSGGSPGSGSVSVTAGATVTSTFASFTDFSGSSTASDYSATITLDDGSTLPATIQLNNVGGFDVTASNDWTIGYDTATITITDTRDTTRVATATTSIDVTAPPATGTGANITATSGQLFSGTVATFTDVALNSLSQYSATIDWGDGHDTAGTITANANGGFDVTGSNRYADAGSYTVTTTLEPYPGGVFYPGGGPIGIRPLVPVATPVTAPITTTTGTTSSGGASNAVHLAGTITSRPDFIAAPVLTAHPAFAGTAIKSSGAAIAFPINGNGGSTATSTAVISAGVMDGTGYSVQATSTAPFSGDVASFTLADPTADLSHYHATITWSDPGIRDWFFSLSNSPSAGVITPDGNGGFTVSTSASFANGGLFHFIVTISDYRLGTGDAATVGVAYGQIIVDSPFRWLPVLLANAPTAAGAAVPGSAASISKTDAGNPVLAEHVKPITLKVKSFASQTFNGDVAAYSGVVSGATKLADLTGTIHWGDGSTSPATFAGGKKGYVVVRGSHSYSAAGSYTPTVDVTQTLYVNGKPSTLYPLHLPLVESAARIVAPPQHSHIMTGGIAIEATAGTTFTGDVASFPAPVVAAGILRTATVYWGDGSHSAGTITTSSTNQLSVTASHMYRKSGKYTVWVSVTQKPAPGASTLTGKVSKVLAYIKTTAEVAE